MKPAESNASGRNKNRAQLRISTKDVVRSCVLVLVLFVFAALWLEHHFGFISKTMATDKHPVAFYDPGLLPSNSAPF
jgi:hypothetical protein